MSPKLTTKISTILNELENCDVQITPACLRALYGLVYVPVATNKNSLGIVEYTPQAYRPADLDMFAKNFSSLGLSLVGARPVLQAVDGGAYFAAFVGHLGIKKSLGVVQNISANFLLNGESNLDLQYAMNLVTPRQKVTLYQVGDLPMGASFVIFACHLY